MWHLEIQPPPGGWNCIDEAFAHTHLRRRAPDSRVAATPDHICKQRDDLAVPPPTRFGAIPAPVRASSCLQSTLQGTVA